MLARQRNKPLSAAQVKAQALKIKRLRMDSMSEIMTGGSVYQSDPLAYCLDKLQTTFTDPIKRVVESVRDNPVTIAVSANGVGKSHAAARIAAWFYKTHPGAKVFTTAAPPVSNLQTILWGEIGSLVRDFPGIFSEDRIYNDMNIKRDSESFITGIAIPSSGTPAEREAKFAGKHGAYMLFIVDEGDAVPTEVYKGIESCMSGGMARLLIMFNPRSDRGAAANMVKKRQGHVIYLSAFDHPNVITGQDVYPGAVSREITLQRINEWTIALAPGEKPDIDCFEVPTFLVGETTIDKGGNEYQPLPAGWRRVENPEFFYKVLGKYPPQSESQLISRAWVEMAVSRYMSYIARFGEVPPKSITPIFGLDVADGGKDKNAMTQRWGGWVAPLRTWAGIDADMTAIKATEIIKSLGVDLMTVRVKVDGTGVGAGVAPRMSRMQNMSIPHADKVMVASAPTMTPLDADGQEMGSFYQLRDQLWWSTMLWLKNDPGAMLPPDDELIEELITPSYGVYNGRVRVSSKDYMKESLGRSPDKAESLILTFAPEEPTAGAW
jgi:hypothetical protein